MPLIKLKTNLKSLKFGKDRPRGGSSNQPYVQKDIPKGEQSDLLSTGGEDFLLRGGALAPFKAADDTSRLTQMFSDLKSPNGLLFTGKLNTLSRTSVKTEASKGVGHAGGFINQGVYLPSSTIAQAGVGFTGTHLNLLGAGVGLKRYEDVVKENNKEENNSFPTLEEKIIKTPNPLYQKQILGATFQGRLEPEFIEKTIFQTSGGFTNRLLDIWHNKQIGYDNSPNILEYSGGPGSILGIGKTNIKFADQRTGERNDLFTSNPGYFWGTEKKNKYKNSPQSNLVSQKLGATKFAENSSIPSLQGIKDISLGNKIQEIPSVETRSPDEISNSGLSNSSTNRENLYSGSTSQPKINFRNATNLDGGSESISSLFFKQGISDNIKNRFYSTGPTYFNLVMSDFTPTTNTRNFAISTTQSGSLKPREEVKNTEYLTNRNNPNIITDGNNPGIKDFRDDRPETIRTLAPDYSSPSKRIEGRTNHGDPGERKRENRTKYSTNSTLDKITSSPIYSQENPDHGSNKNDLVKFSIGIIQNNSSGQSDYMNFRAFLGSFSDSYEASWDEQNYIGRGDKFFNYKGFTRDISLDFKVVAQSKGELIPMYKKLNYLASSMTPDYSQSGFMRGNLIRLTVGGYLYNQLGILKSLSYSIPNDSPWEIGINEEGGYDSSVKELSHMIDVKTFSFTPIQDFLPKRANPNDQSATRYIALSNGGNNNY